MILGLEAPEHVHTRGSGAFGYFETDAQRKYRKNTITLPNYSL